MINKTNGNGPNTGDYSKQHIHIDHGIANRIILHDRFNGMGYIDRG